MVINAEEKGKVDKGSGNGGGSGKAHNIFISSLASLQRPFWGQT